ncbi:MAG: acyltransferase [Clostridia bacterium]|nr:acyltransferase [Clostridia bacterium]
MSKHKFLTVLITVMMVVTAMFSTVFADEESEETTVTTESGITISIPSDYFLKVWNTLTEEEAAKKGIAFEMVEQIRNYGIELTFTYPYATNMNYNVSINELDAPSEVSENTLTEGLNQLLINPIDDNDCLTSGFYKVNDINFFMIHYQNDTKDGEADLYQYSFITDNGKQHAISFKVDSAEMTSASYTPVELTNPEEAYEYLAQFSEQVISTVTLSDDLKSHIVPFDFEADDLTSSSESVKGNPVSTLSGITLYPTSDFFWASSNAMQEGDPWMALYEVSPEDAAKQYEAYRLELQTGDETSDGADKFLALVTEREIPEEISEETLNAGFDNNIGPGMSNFDTAANVGYGVVNVGGISMYKTFYDADICVYQYLIMTTDGIIHEIDFFCRQSSDENKTKLDNITASMINSMELSDELVAKVVPFEGEEFRLISGDYTQCIDVENSEVGSNAASTATAAAATPTPKPKTIYQKVIGFEFPTWIILIALVVILFAGVKFSGIKGWQEEPFSLEASKAIQGLCAVSIIIHHLAQDLMEKAGVLSKFSEFGVLFVGVFFFFSGYGLYTSLKTKKNYLKGFLKKRLTIILVPFYVCISVFVVSACICGEKFELKRLISVLTGWSLINDHMWYIVEIAILYILFFVIYRLIKNRTAATVVMTVCTIGMIIGSLLLGHGEDFSCSFWFMGEWWYNSTFLFVIGILVSKHSDVLRKIVRKGYWLFLVLFGGLTVWFSFLTKHALEAYSYWSEIPGVDPAYDDKLRCLAVQLPWILFFVCFLLLVMMKVNFNNPVLKFLGSISLELYLCHNLFRQGLQDGSIAKIPSASMYILLTILLSIGLATIINGFDKYIIALIVGKKKLPPSSCAVGDGFSSSGELPLKKASSRIHSIDCMRILMAFLVVCIHFPFNGKAGEVFITYGKTAVPFFLAVCGYMLYRDDSKDMMKRLVKQTKRIGIFYVASFVFYILVNILSIRIDTGNFNAVRMLYSSKMIPQVLLYNYWMYAEHLWFLGSLFYALLIMLLLNKLKVLNKAIYAGPFLIAAYVVLSHMDIGEPYQLRNAVLVGLSYTMSGMIIRKWEKKLLNIKHISAILFATLAVTCVTAIVELNTYAKGVEVPFISCEIMTFVLLLLCLKYKDLGKGTFMEKLGRECSLPIYIMHIAVLFFLPYVVPESSGFISNYGAVTVFVVTTVFVAIYEDIKHAIVTTKSPKTESIAVENAEV